MSLTQFFTFSLLFILSLKPLVAQKKITLEDIEAGVFRSKGVRQIKWLKDGAFYTALKDNKIIKYKLTDGKEVETIYSDAPVDIVSYSFSADEQQILLLTEREKIYRRSYRAEFYIYHRQNKTLEKLSEGGKQAYATFSPDGTKVAFVRDNNIFYKNLKTKTEYALTTDGKFNSLINGSTDWVYEEEFAFTKAFFWSPNSTKIAYYTFDETAVKEYNMQVWEQNKNYPRDYKFKYPKAGETNSQLKITVYNLLKKTKQEVDLKGNDDIYIPAIQWTKDNQILAIIKLNRWQNELDILHYNDLTKTTQLVLSEKNETFIDFNYCGAPIYLTDQKHFIYVSESSGYKHLYLYTNEGKLIRQITEGEWEVDNFLGFNEQNQNLYFTSTEVLSLERHFYQIGLDGKNKTQLSKTKGTHRIDMSTDYSYYVDRHSSLETLPNVSLYKTRGNEKIKVLEDNGSLKTTLKDYKFSSPEFFTFKAEDGLLLNAMRILPPDFDENKKYPVLVHVYGGPGSQLVRDSWAGRHFYWHQYLAQQGYIVVIADNRGTDGRGSKFKRSTYLNLGQYETRDQIDLVKYLHQQSYVDKSRIGVWGWSYGGYMSSLLITLGADFYKLAIAVAPVTHWRFYDSIYTERYLRRPRDNQKGYDDYSPVLHADKLKGKYLLIHGTGDDNVHFQNAIAMQNALIQAKKQFETFYYPNQAHGLAKSRSHLYNMMARFVIDNL